MRILVADDDAALRAMLTEYLTARGVEVLEAADGVETLRHMTRSRLNAVELDAVVLDLQMPRLGGIEALRRLRSYCPALAVVVLTGSMEPAFHRQAHALGVQAVLPKPVVLARLWDVLLGDTSAIGDHEAARERAGVTRPAAPRSADTRVLLIDDDGPFQETVVEFLDSRGYRTAAAADALTGIRAAIADPPDIVLLDIGMPGLNGNDALPTIRAIAPRAAVIMITANTDREIARRSLVQGAFDYLVKPLNFRHLNQSIQMALEVKALDAAAARETIVAAAPDEPIAAKPAATGAARTASPWTVPSVKVPQRNGSRAKGFRGIGSKPDRTGRTS